MALLLACGINDKIRSELLELRDAVRTAMDADWIDDDQLCIRLGVLDAGLVDRHADAVQSAMDRAANAHQGFNVELSGVDVEALHGGGHGVVLRVRRKGGMLQSVMESFRDRSPADIDLDRVDPWRPQLVLAELARDPGEEARLKLEAAGHGKGITMGVKQLQLRDGSDVRYEATLPSSGG